MKKELAGLLVKYENGDIGFEDIEEYILELLDEQKKEVQPMLEAIVDEGLVHDWNCEGLPCDCVAKESKKEIIPISKKHGFNIE